jgi:non-ribosomal peptide synthetase component F
VRHLEDFLVDLKRLHIEIWSENGRLRFKAPKGALNEQLRTELTERKEEILNFLRRKTLFEQPIPRLAKEETAPISFAQQRLLFLEQLEEEQAVYNIPAVFDCKGRLDEKLLAASLLTLIERHESLRTCFPNLDGQATARVCEACNPLHVSDLSTLPELEQERQIQELISEHARLNFDLSSGPLLDLHLLNLSNGRQMLLFNMHHIISDGWSVGVLIREWKEIYNALAAGQEPELPELPIQYSDYAAWQRQWLEQGILSDQLTYWRNQLVGLPELLELPTDFPRPPVMGTEGRHLRSSLHQELTGKIKQISREQGATLFMTLLAAFNILLHRWSGQDDLAVGSPIANRTHSQTEGLIGFFCQQLGPPQPD